MSGSTGDPTKWLEFAQKHWHQPAALVAILFVVLPLLTAIMVFMKVNPIIGGVTYIIVVLLVILGWWWSNRLPRTAKRKVGFIISISAGEEAERTKIKEDFTITLHELLKHGASGHNFQVITVPEHIANTIVDPDDAQKLRIKCRAHFVIFGRVRLRTIDGKKEHVLHLEGMVTHKPIPKDVSEVLSVEFAELLPRRLRIGTENDVFSFAFTSEWINCVARYIIGIAAAYSGDLDYAEIMQNDVLRLIANKDQAFPVFAKLNQRVPIRLGEIRCTRARGAYNRWLTTRDPTDIATMGHHIESIPSAYANEYGTLLLKSIYLFLNKRDTKGAMALLKNCKNQSEGTWLYNMAFLHAYVGDLSSAIRRYRAAMKLRVDESVPMQVEEFMCWLLQQEPEKYQIYYCLGFINWKVKGDSARAIGNFDAFLSAGDERDFVTERQLARKWIGDIRQTTHESTRTGNESQLL